MRPRGRDLNIARETASSSPDGEALLQRRGLCDLGERWHEQQVVSGAIESFEQSLGWRDEQGASRPFDEALAGEPPEYERHRLARGAHQLAQQTVSRATEL